MLSLISRDVRLLTLQVAQRIDSLQDALLAETVDGKGDRLAVGQGEGLGFQIHCNGLFRIFGNQLLELPMGLGIDGDGHQTVFQGVVLKDVGKTGADDDLKAAAHQGPDGVLAAGATPEIVPGHQDPGLFGCGLVQDKVRVAAPVVEEMFAQAGPVDPLEKLGRDDLVGVDILDGDGHHRTAQGGELFHG